ncbi:uncharacterized protein [Miscanthus floridulus]|uniref:uncharacterized protein n=1 Tax=Miscanthus floridulus TaxID=154761 RepID=UPI00345AB75B
MLPSMILQGALLCCRKAAARREALVDGSAACDPGTPGSVRWCSRAKGMAANRYRAAPVLQAAARSDEVARCRTDPVYIGVGEPEGVVSSIPGSNASGIVVASLPDRSEIAMPHEAGAYQASCLWQRTKRLEPVVALRLSMAS